MRCQVCGLDVMTGMSVCPRCGTPMAHEATPAPPRGQDAAAPHATQGQVGDPSGHAVQPPPGEPRAGYPAAPYPSPGQPPWGPAGGPVPGQPPMWFGPPGPGAPSVGPGGSGVGPGGPPMWYGPTAPTGPAQPAAHTSGGAPPVGFVTPPPGGPGMAHPSPPTGFGGPGVEDGSQEKKPTAKSSPRPGSSRRLLVIVGSVAAAVVLIAAGLIVVPKLLAPNVAALRDKGDVAGLIAALVYKDDPQIRKEAALALGASKAPEALAPLLTAQSDVDAAVSAAATSASVDLAAGLADDAATRNLLALSVESAAPVGGSEGAAVRTLNSYLERLGMPRALQATLTVQNDSRSQVSQAALDRSMASLSSYPDVTAALTGLIEFAKVTTGAWSEGATAAVPVYLDSLNSSTALVALLAVSTDARPAVAAVAEKALPSVIGGLSDESLVAALLSQIKVGSKEVKSRAQALLNDQLVAMGVKRGVKAVLDTKAGDAWLAVALRVKVSDLSAETRKRNIQLDKLDWITGKASKVPKGTRIKEAPSYKANGRFHPLIVIRKDNPSFTWKAVSPTALRFLELVAVVSVSERVVQVCPYTNNVKVTRYRPVVTIKLYSAQSARLVTTKTLTGGTPSYCKSTVWAVPGDRLEIHGSTPNPKPWLSSVVHAP